MGLVEELQAARAAQQLPPPRSRRAIRLRAGASLRRMGQELGVTPMTVLRWERGEAKPRDDRALAYRELLDALKEQCQ